MSNLFEYLVRGIVESIIPLALIFAGVLIAICVQSDLGLTLAAACIGAAALLKMFDMLVG